MDFDANGLRTTEMSDNVSVYPEVESESAFTVDINDDLINSFNNQSFAEGSAIFISKKKIQNSNKDQIRI